jgi:hypothetical protein
MGKTISKSTGDSAPPPAGTPARSSDGTIVAEGSPHLSAEQRQKYAELREWLAKRAAAAERMTPEERAQAEADWKAFKKSMNDARAAAGARLVYGDDD